jgi:hypothetical protein
MRKVLGICGDSFMSSDLPDRKGGSYGNHFSEILGKMLDCDVVTFARSGVSNFAIRLQMDEIVKHNPHHVIIGTTTPDRFEIPINDLTVGNPWDKWSNSEFNPINGIYNVVYDGFECQSTNHRGFKNITPTIYSQSLTGAIGTDEENIWITPNKTLTKEMSSAIRTYFQYMYDMRLKLQQDTWIISEGTHMLISKGIDFSLITPQINGDYFTHCMDSIVPNGHILNPWTHYEMDKTSKNTFHVSNERSQILAELWYDKLKHKF